MKDLFKNIFVKRFNIPKAQSIENTVSRFSLTEKVIFYFFAVALSVSTLSLLWQINGAFMVIVPARGGTLSEGVIGLPRFINPILAISDADRDLTALTYSGLLKPIDNGTLVPNLAESYSISEDGLTYTFVLKKGLTFHDGSPITADDVVFTIGKAQDPTLKSPKRANWEGVQVEKVNDYQVKLTLKQPYSPFLENTTLGILPKHIWNDITGEEFQFSKFNTEPIGSGPYTIKSISKNSAGIPLSYNLESFNKYVFGEPLIKNLILHFYQNSNNVLNALNNKSIESVAGISPQQVTVIQDSDAQIERTPLPRIFALFFNQNQAPVLANKEVRDALNTVINKESIVENVLLGEGIAIDSPIPPGLIQKSSSASAPLAVIYKSNVERIAAAKNILEKAGWKFNEEKNVYEKTVKKVVTPLAFSISTSDAPELKAVALMIKDMGESLGAQIEVKIFDIGELNQNVIRPRKYDSLLFGEIIGRDLDLFAFWHSSQRNDPGLNVALYTNAQADKLLEDTRTIADREIRLEKYGELEKEIVESVPAIFIYSPDFLYVVPKTLQGFSMGLITTPAERFMNVEKWYVETESVWKIFAKKQ
ncbi:MAG: ABC transporter substrate-binding protein [Patescibacteria group bacterium]